MSEKSVELPSQNVFNFGCVTFASNFDNGNLARVKKIELGLPYQYRIWVAVDNDGEIVSLRERTIGSALEIRLCR